MRWSRAGANALLQVRCAALNGQDVRNFKRWHPPSQRIGEPQAFVLRRSAPGCSHFGLRQSLDTVSAFLGPLLTISHQDFSLTWMQKNCVAPSSYVPAHVMIITIIITQL